MRSLHCTLAATLVAWSAAFASGQETPAAGGTRFTIFVQGVAVGSDVVTVTRTVTGTVIDGSARVAPPMDMVTRGYEVRYDASLKPTDATLQGTIRGQSVYLRTLFAGGIAANEILQGTQRTTKTDKVSADAVVLFNQAPGTYEALALRLHGLQVGAELSCYIPPQGESHVKVVAVTPEHIRTPEASIDAHRYQLAFGGAGADLAIELWTDASDRMLRLAVPSQAFEATREDVASVRARHEVLPRPDDEQVTILSTGFSLAATVSKPPAGASRPGPLPAVVLVAGADAPDRDETADGMPMFALLANAIADQGFLVVRYDKRGVGQSGGRAESATIADYAEDARAVVRYVARRKDVDRSRIALAGYVEGGWAALLAASNDGAIDAVALLATPGSTGADVYLEQQRNALDRMKLTDADRQAKIALQTKIQQAVLTGKGWAGVPADMRRQADTPWFQSFLAFDPARVMKKVSQPVLIVEGELDKAIPSAHADRLAALARTRKGPAGAAVQLVKLPGLNHLFVPAKTGEVEEYASLKDETVSPQVVSTIVAWLQKAMPGKKRH